MSVKTDRTSPRQSLLYCNHCGTVFLTRPTCQQCGRLPETFDAAMAKLAKRTDEDEEKRRPKKPA